MYRLIATAVFACPARNTIRVVHGNERTMITLDSEDTLRMNKVLRHRLRNVASGIRNAVSLLSKELDERLNPNEREYFPLLVNECNELAGMTDRMNLLFEKFPPGNPGQLGALCEQVVSTMRVRFPAVELVVEYAERDVEQALVNSDAHFLGILGEAVLNAVESRPGGKIVLCSELENGSLKVSVIDEGKGVPEEHYQNAFLPFFTMKPRHIGIGLAFAGKLAGELGVEMRFRRDGENRFALDVFFPACAPDSDDATVSYGNRRKE